MQSPEKMLIFQCNLKKNLLISPWINVPFWKKTNRSWWTIPWKLLLRILFFDKVACFLSMGSLEFRLVELDKIAIFSLRRLITEIAQDFFTTCKFYKQKQYRFWYEHFFLFFEFWGRKFTFLNELTPPTVYPNCKPTPP